MIIALGFFIFGLAVKYLPIFDDAHHAPHALVTELATLPETAHQPTLVH
jgi:hypothetical protein